MMNNLQDFNYLLSRIDRLEQQNRRFNRSRMIHFILLTVLLALYGLEYQGISLFPGKTVSAEMFLLTDPSGAVLAQLEGKGTLLPTDWNRREPLPRIVITRTDGQPGLYFYDGHTFYKTSPDPTDSDSRLVCADFTLPR